MLNAIAGLLVLVCAALVVLMIGQASALKDILIVGGLTVAAAACWALDFKIERAKRAKLAAMSDAERADYEAQALADRSW